MESKKLKFKTRAIHAGIEPAPKYKAIMTPIYMSSTFVQDNPGEFLENFDYSRAGNPTRDALEKNLASIEEAEACYAFSSGVAAADVAMRLLKSGDHVICADDVYGGSFRLFNRMFKPHGISFSYIDLNDQALLEQTVTENTKLIWFETPTNPLLKIFDIEKNISICQD